MKTAEATEPKLSELIALLKRLSPVALAYSGGLDSRFLAFVAKKADVDIHLYHICGPHISSDETEKAKAWAISQRIDITCLPINTLLDPGVAENGDERCYFCKKMLIEAIMEATGVIIGSERLAAFCPVWKEGLGLPKVLTWQAEEHAKREIGPGSLRADVLTPTVCDGNNVSDFEQFRPGMRAMSEYGVWPPLAVCGFTKDDIRRIAAKIGLDEPSQKAKPCLLTRFAYLLPADEKTLNALDRAEKRIDELLNLAPAEAFTGGVSGKPFLPDFRLRVFGPMEQPGMVELHIQNTVSQDFAGKLAAEAASFGFAAPAVRLLEKVSGWYDRHRSAP